MSSCVVAIMVIYSTRSDVMPATSLRGLDRVARPDVYAGPGGAGVHGLRYDLLLNVFFFFIVFHFFFLLKSKVYLVLS